MFGETRSILSHHGHLPSSSTSSPSTCSAFVNLFLTAGCPSSSIWGAAKWDIFDVSLITELSWRWQSLPIITHSSFLRILGGKMSKLTVYSKTSKIVTSSGATMFRGVLSPFCILAFSSLSAEIITSQPRTGSSPSPPGGALCLGIFWSWKDEQVQLQVTWVCAAIPRLTAPSAQEEQWEENLLTYHFPTQRIPSLLTLLLFHQKKKKT